MIYYCVATVFFFLCVAAFFATDVMSKEYDTGAGSRSFAAVCASCHGQTGMGDGIASAALEPKPRDLSNSNYMSKLTDEYMFNVINMGGPAVGKSVMMPAWGGVLGEEGTWQVVAYIRKEICKCEFTGK